MLNVNPIFLAETWESFAEVDKSKSHQVSKFSFFLALILAGKGTKTCLLSGMLQVQNYVWP